MIAYTLCTCVVETSDTPRYLPVATNTYGTGGLPTSDSRGGMVIGCGLPDGSVSVAIRVASRPAGARTGAPSAVTSLLMSNRQMLPSRSTPYTRSVVLSVDA